MTSCRWWAAIAAIFFSALPSTSLAVGPYAPDAHTLHLWHMNATATPLLDSATTEINPNTTPLDLQWINDGTGLGSASYNGFGTAADTFSSTIDPINSPNGSLGKAPGVFALQPASGAADDTPTTTFWNQTTGAFTYEAVVKVLIDPATIVGNGDISDPGNYGGGSNSQIISMDNDSGGGGRGFQFNFVKYADGQYAMEYVAITGGDGTTQVSNSLPAPVQGAWYHAAVAYGGPSNLGGDDSLKFYWTEITPTTTSATLASTDQMLPSPSVATGADFSIGNEARTGQTGNWMGLIDEVRISDVARGPDDFIFSNPTPPPPSPGDFNSDGNVDGADFAIWQESFPSSSGGTLGTGDADGDGDVDGADFVVWQTHFPTSSAGTTAVPEPGGLVLGGLGAMLLQIGMRQFQRRRSPQ